MEQQLALMKFTRRCVIENTIANAILYLYFIVNHPQKIIKSLGVDDSDPQTD